MQVIEDRRAEAKRKYGYDVGQSGALLLIALDEEGTRNRLLIQEAISRINEGNQPMQTENPKAAFWFGIGRSGILVLPMLLAISLIWWSHSQQEDYQVVRSMLEKYPNASEFQYLMKNGQLKKTDDGALNLILTPAPADGSVESGLHYVYNENCKCVYIPLHF